MTEKQETIWLTPEEAADYIRVAVTTIYKYIKEDGLKATKISRNNYRILKSDLDEWMKSHSTN